MNHLKEIAKFACGAEAFHAFIHTYFWLSGTSCMFSDGSRKPRRCRCICGVPS